MFILVTAHVRTVEQFYVGRSGNKTLTTLRNVRKHRTLRLSIFSVLIRRRRAGGQGKGNTKQFVFGSERVQTCFRRASGRIFFCNKQKNPAKIIFIITKSFGASCEKNPFLVRYFR